MNEDNNNYVQEVSDQFAGAYRNNLSSPEGVSEAYNRVSATGRPTTTQAHRTVTDRSGRTVSDKTVTTQPAALSDAADYLQAGYEHFVDRLPTARDVVDAIDRGIEHVTQAVSPDKTPGNTYTDRFGRQVPFEEGKYYRSGNNYFLWQDGKRVPADPNQRDNFRRQRDTEIDLENLDMNAERYNAEVAERDKHDKALKDIDNKYFKVRDNGDGTNDIIINDEDYEKRRYEQKRADRIYKSKQDSIRDRYNNPDDDITPYDEDFLKNPDFDRITNPILYTYKGRDGRYHSYEEGKTYRDADGNTFIWQNSRPRLLPKKGITSEISEAQTSRYNKQKKR